MKKSIVKYVILNVILSCAVISCEKDSAVDGGYYTFHDGEFYADEHVVLQEIMSSMIFVEGGTFRMGGGDNPSSQPEHYVTVSSFYIGETEVTQRQWKAIMKNNPSYFKGDDRPVEGVTWYDCQEFIKKLNQLTGKKFRLPTEAEWEYAARGGKYHSDYKYSGSDNANDVAWCFSNSFAKTHPVKKKKPNALGIYDMSGNVKEWCMDWYGDYHLSDTIPIDPIGPPSSGEWERKVLRGDSWYYYIDPVTWRDYNNPQEFSSPGGGLQDGGFRLVMEVEEGNQEALPNVITKPVNNITSTTATFNGSVTSDSWVSSRGFCWGTSSNPTLDNCLSQTSVGNGTGDFSYNISGLSTGTTYYVRAWATNSAGTEYGENVNFTTGPDLSCPGTPTLTDFDGNIYNSVQIGQQCWMKENLRTTHYADGTSLSPGSDYYDNDINSTYGLFYNWPAVMNGESSSNAIPSGVRGICPYGWHVPSRAEWGQLLQYVQSQNLYCEIPANIAKALAANVDWYNSSISCAVGNDLSANNSTGFSALPAGGYDFSNFGTGGQTFFWSSTLASNGGSYDFALEWDSPKLITDFQSRSLGLSVRCIKD